MSATFKAKDILRAARLPLLGTDNPHVASDLAKIHAATPLSPILIVRGDLAADGRLDQTDARSPSKQLIACQTPLLHQPAKLG